MSRCDLSNKDCVVKNLVSHSKIKTKSTAFPNVHRKRLYSDCLKEFFSFKVATSTLKTIDKKGGLDVYLLGQKDQLLSKRALNVKNKIKRKIGN